MFFVKILEMKIEDKISEKVEKHVCDCNGFEPLQPSLSLQQY